MATRTLLVEGIDDMHVMMHLCGSHNIPHLDNIVNAKGIAKLLIDLPVRLKAGQPGDILGIVIDADENIAARWQSLRHTIVDKGYLNVPRDPVPIGCILDPPDNSLLPRLGVWIMPDNQNTGMLEDFLPFLVPSDGAALFKHAEDSVDAIPSEHMKFRPVDRSKAVIHTWLAWQEEPGKPFGTAINEGFLDPTLPEVAIIVTWLRQLFFPSAG